MIEEEEKGVCMGNKDRKKGVGGELCRQLPLEKQLLACFLFCFVLHRFGGGLNEALDGIELSVRSLFICRYSSHVA